MKLIKSPREMQKTALQIRRTGQVIAFVPTMGYLHEGHLSLMRLGKSKCKVLVVSIFVNPIQFGPDEDLARYPRNLERDKQLCADEGVDILFCPEIEEIYAPDHSVYVEETNLSRSLCGTSRPVHFRGVTTVVAKLFNIVQPDIAVFGQKDAQQARIIQKMTKDLNFPVEIIIGPIVREADGLAMSSRNTYLSPEERKGALCLSQSLKLARRLYDEGLQNARDIKKKMRELIEEVPFAEIDYIEIVDYGTFEPVKKIEGETLIALAVTIGETRLIDNLLLQPGDVSPQDP